MRILLLLLATVPACGGSTAPSSSPRETTSPLIGRWTSEAGEERPGPAGPLYLRRTFSFTASDSDNQILFFADNTFTVKTMLFEFGGSFSTQGPSPKVPGATMGKFPIERLAITPLHEGTVQFLSSLPAGTCGSGWAVGVRQELATGCAAFGIQTGVTTEHDIFKVENDRLYFGARPADGSLLDTEAKRPTSWQVPLARTR